MRRFLQPWLLAGVQDAWPRATPSRLTSCLLLALLLHVWLVLMLGNAPPGTAPPGRGVWGALNITLRGPAQDGSAAATPLPASLPGTAPSPRFGGAVRAPAARPLPEPGAARRGDWAATPAREPEVPVAVLPVPLPETARPPLPAAVLDPPSPPVERRLGGAAGIGPAAVTPPAPLERIRAPAPETARLPLPQALPVPASLAPLAVAPPSPAPAPVPAPVPAPATATATATATAAVEPPAAPVAPLAPTARVATPAEPAPVPAAPPLRRVAPIAPAAVAAATMAPIQALPTQAPVGLPALAASPRGTAGPAAPTLPAGRPDAGPQVGYDVATAPGPPASAPRLNLELPRLRGGQLSRLGGAGVLPLLPRPPELPDKLARDIDKAAKADCRTAYQGLGLLAVVPLAADALGGGKGSGCKW